MAKKPLQINNFGRQDVAKFIAYTWDKYNKLRHEQIERWKEQRNYVFATDTTTTSNKNLPWKNSTTLPKLCQIRDNLHSNYISALFPNDQWLRWEAYSLQDATKKKAKAIEAYLGNKCREGGFKRTMSQLLYDYIDYGNVFGTVDYESQYREDATGKRVPGYIGPIVRRISPYDIVFNPLAQSFKDSFKIVRSVKTIGELAIMAEEQPDNLFLREALAQRNKLNSHMNAYGLDDFHKQEGIQIDGFGNMQEYLQSGYVEILTFYGDIYDEKTNVLTKGREIMVVDRMWKIEDRDIPSWFDTAPIFHVGWRVRPDNLWAQGPLENLVGMQYRMDHLENAKADAMDLGIHPPLVIKGEVEEFKYGPGEEIHIDENGDVTELARNAQWVLQADNAIDRLEMRMEQFAGAPREAMGIRSAGEKTAFEVQQLQNSASRIFQEKINTFETELLEPLLNAMLETGRRNLDANDVVKAMDDDLGITTFMEITKDDITANGVIRPIGARHFAAQAQLVQNLTQLANTPVWQQISPHMSNKALATLVEDVMGLTRFALFQPNVAVIEQMELQQIANQAGEENAMLQQQPPLE
jgi:Bacteriophage head to tail connecting protein